MSYVPSYINMMKMYSKLSYGTRLAKIHVAFFYNMQENSLGYNCVPLTRTVKQEQ